MKEATGEANMTVITIVLIGVVVAIATPLITSMMKNTEKSSCCQSNGGIWKNGTCYASCTGSGSSMTCSGSVSTACPKE